MVNRFGLQIDESYLSAIGHAAFNFARLEWEIVWIVESLSPDYVSRKTRGKFLKEKTAGEIAGDFLIEAAAYKGDAVIKDRLEKLAELFKELVIQRNMLLHASPYHDASLGRDGLFYLGRHGLQMWPEADIWELAEAFLNAEREGSALRYDHLPQSPNVR